MKKPSRRRDNRFQSHPRGKSRLSRELKILYEDDAIVVVDKPPGLVAVPIEGSATPSAWSLLTAELKTRRQKAFVVHRIDRFTSGLLLFAKTSSDRDHLVRQFLSHTPLRQYLAVVRGHVAAEPGAKEEILIHHFRRYGMHQKQTTERDAEGARAELRYSVERRLRAASLVRVTLITGLQNQIRVQLSAIGHPVIGDRKYHPEEASEKRIDRVALHAVKLEFIHPRTGKSMALESTPPKDFQSLVRALSPPTKRGG